MNRYKSIVLTAVCSLLLFKSFAQKETFEPDFTQLEIFAEQGDYKGGFFYSKKLISTLEKKGSEINLLRSNCFLAYFSEMLDKSADLAAAQRAVHKYLPALSKTENTYAVASAFSIYADYFVHRGQFLEIDSAFQLVKKELVLLPPYDRERIQYYQLLSLAGKGYLNKVIQQTDNHVKTVQGCIPRDTLFDLANGGYMVAELTASNRNLRENLIANLILLKGKAYLDNGLTDSAIAYLQKNESLISRREGNNAKYHSLLGYCFLDNDEYHLAEKEFKTASALSSRFFLAHAPEQITIETGLVKSLQAQGKKEETDYYKNDITIKLIGYFNKTNLVYLNNNYADIEYEIAGHNWPKAETMLKSFLQQPVLPKASSLRIAYLKTLIPVLIKQQKHEEAESTMNEALSIQAQLTGTASPAYQIMLLTKACFYSFNLDKFKEAKTLFSNVLDSDFQKQISIENPDYYLNTLAFAKVYIYTEEFGMTENRLQSYLKRAETEYGNTHNLYAIYLAELGELKTITGDYTAANTYLTNSVSIFEKNNKKKYTRRYIETLELFLKLEVIEGDYDAADALLTKAKKAAEDIYILDAEDLFMVEEIGLLYSKKGEYQKANKVLSSILQNKVQSVGEMHKSICTTLEYLGEQNLIVGNYAEADDYFNRAMQITKNIYGDKSIPYATSLLYYKQLHTAIGDYEKAESNMKEALQIYLKTYGEKNIKTGILMHETALATFQADIYTTRKNKTKRADLESQFLKALAIIKNTEGDNSILYAEALENYSIFLALTNEYASALSNIDIAKKIWESKAGKNNVHSAQLTNLAGRIYYRSGKYAQALTAFEKTRDDYKNIFDDSHPGYVFALGSCAQMYYILGNTSKAIESIEECTNKSLLYIDKVFPFLSERGKMAYWDKIKDDFEFYKTIAFTNSKEHPEMIGKILNIQLQTKSILLNSQLKIKNKIYASGDTTAIRLYQDWQDLRDNLAIAYSLNATQRKEENMDIVLLEMRLEATEKQLSSISADFVEQSKNKTSIYTWKNVKQSLQDHEIAIETIPFRYYTKSFSDTIWYAFVAVTNKSGEPAFAIEKNGAELETKYLKYYRNMIRFSKEDNTSYDQYWKTIATLIEPAYTTIYFAADGVYNQINVETLKNEQGNYLINSANIITIGSSRDVINKNTATQTKQTKQETTQKPEIDLIGNPTYFTNPAVAEESALEQLPGSETEVKKINTLLAASNWKTQMFIGNAATEDTVKSIKNPNVLHISTHGFFWQDAAGSEVEIAGKNVTNPLLMSGVLLFNGGELLTTDNINAINKEDGILTAYEAMNLSLDKTELVVLSACETGLGEVKIGEGVYGLQRSFTVAGAKSIIMSLSKVSDEVTIKLMENFYTNWIQSGNKREAFNKAKKDLMKEYPDAKYWGAFVMIGL